MTKRYLYYIGILLLFGGAECLLTPLLNSLSISGSAWLYPLYYLTKLLALGAPFILLGSALEAFTAFYSFHTFWLYFFPYLLISIAAKVPFALAEVASDGLSSFGLAFLAYALTALLNALLVLLAALLSYFIFFFKKEEITTHDAFFTKASADSRGAILCAVLITVYFLVMEVLGIIKDGASRLWILDGLDIGNYLFSIFFVCLRGFAAYVFSRLGGRLSRTAEE